MLRFPDAGPPLAELLARSGDGDFLRSVAETVVQSLTETDVGGLTGAERNERAVADGVRLTANRPDQGEVVRERARSRIVGSKRGGSASAWLGSGVLALDRAA